MAVTSSIAIAPLGIAEDAGAVTPRSKYDVLLRRLHDVLGFFVFCELMAIIAVVLGGVISRYVFNSSFTFTEELASWLLIALTFTGMAAGHVAERHVTIDLTSRLGLPPWVEEVRKFAVDLIVALSLVLLLTGGVGVFQHIGGPSPALEWDVRIKIVVIPFACVLALACILVRKRASGEPWPRAVAPLFTALAIYIATTFMDQPWAGVNPVVLMTVAFFVGLFMGVPVAFAMLFAGFLPGWGGNLLPVTGAVSAMAEGTGSFVILAIPFFLTAGYLMNSGGMSRRLIDFAYALTGHFRGGLAQANVFHSLLLGGVSGSSTADAASTTKILVPEMIRRGYSPSFACAATAVGSILPGVFPPSISLLVYASVSGVSVAKLFAAGIVPGFLLCAVMMLVVRFIAARRNYEKAPHRAPLRQMARTGLSAFPALFLVVVILGLLRQGVMTATEVGIIAVLWAFVIGMFVHRETNIRVFYRDMVDCGIDVALIVFLVSVAHPVAWVLLAEQTPQHLVTWLVPLIHEKWQLFFLVNLGAFIAGCLLEVIPSILILAPILTPLFMAMGVDPIHGGMIIMLNLLLATAAPPMGILVFVSASIAKLPPGPIFRESIPFLIACYSVLLLVTFVPQVALGLWQFLAN